MGICLQDELRERRLIAYISKSAYCYAKRWRQSWRKRAQREVLQLNAPIREVVEGSDEFGSLIPGAPAAEEEYLVTAPIEQTISDVALLVAYQKLSPTHRKVLKDLVFDLRTQRDVADRLGVTQQSVSFAKRQALRHLRRAVRAKGRSDRDS